MGGAAPAVSVVIPVYNRAGTLGRAIDSVRGQDWADWELLVVDDGSADGGVAVAEAYGDPRIRVLRHPVNRGASAARNTGVAAARGRYVAFLDSDDEWLPGKLAAQLAVLEGGPEAPDVLCTAFVLRNAASGRTVERHPRPAGSWFETMLDGCTVSPGSTLVARRTCFDVVGPLDESLPRLEDWDWLLRCLETHRFGCLDTPGALVHLGRHPPLAMVADAVRRLDAAQAERIRRVAGAAGLRRFRASLGIELAVAALRGGRRWPALRHGLAAFGQSPVRVLRFLARRLVPAFPWR